MTLLSKNWILIVCTLLLSGCGSGGSSDDNEEDEGNSDSASSHAVPVYNQAYSENFDADNINDIQKASNAYVLLDPFSDGVAESIAAIKANNNQIGAYISIGTGETFREDFALLQPFLVSTPWAEWPDEYFVNSTTTGVLDVMKSRIDKIAEWEYDWVEFDNMDWASYDDVRATYNLQVSKEEGISYYQSLCDYVHSKGMKCMAKNIVEGASSFDGVLYESYNNDKNWWEQSGTQEFLDAGKLVIINHYNESNCNQVYSEYQDIYNENISFICEVIDQEKYVHFNE